MLRPRDIAAVLDTPDDPWSTERARRWMVKSGAGVKRCGRIVTTRERLLQHWPEALARWLETQARIESEDEEEYD